jgi:beta-glucosidase
LGQLPVNADGSTNPGGVSGDPGLLNLTRTPSGIGDLGGFRLRTGSPALSAGAVVPNNGGRDFFGNPLPANESPNMGAYQGAGVMDNARPASVEFTNPALNAPSGTTVTVSADMHWWSNSNSAGARADLLVPNGWAVTPLETQLPKGARPGDAVALRWQVTPPAAAAAGTYELTARVLLGAAVKASTTTSIAVSPLYSELSDAFNRVAVTDDSNPGPGQLAASNSSLSAQALLAAKGIAPGARVNGSAVTYTWPSFVPGSANAVRTEGQNIAAQGSGSKLGFVVFGINGSPAGAGKVTYTDGSVEDFALAAGDYYYNKGATGNSTFAVMDYRNIPSGQDRRTVTIFESTIALDPAKTVSYVTLPQMPAQTDAKSPGMFVLAMGLGK